MADDESNEKSPLEILIESTYKPVDPIKFEAPPFDVADTENYSKSLTPHQLLNVMPFERNLAIKQLRRELHSGRIEGIAHQAIWHLSEDRGSLSNMVIRSWIWQLGTPDAESDFWETGYFDVWVPSTIHEYHVELSGRIKMYGVRFWPEGDAFTTFSDHDTGKDDDAKLKPLPKAEAGKISRTLLDHYGSGLTETRAFNLVKGIFPENRVSRDPFLEIFRAIRGPKSPGKPRSDGK